MSDNTDTTILDHSSLKSRLTGTINTRGNVSRYRGIPYATLTKRWTRCSRNDVLEPDFDARSFGPKCVQSETMNNTTEFGPYLPFPDCGQDEFKCLNLNVICPTRIEGQLPVFVWIHGGGWLWGANSDPMWEGTSLVELSIAEGKPIVVVAINYRLGAFGFQNPRDPDDPACQAGNFGLHDQRCALEWISRHTSGFGGDPNQITIAGESAGGGSVHAQVALQEKLDGPRLSQRAILQSGTVAVMGFYDRHDMDNQWEEAVTQAGFQKDEDVLQRMRELPASELPKLSMFNLEPHLFLDDYFISEPCFGPQGEFLRHKPTKVDAIMHGDMGDEGTFMLDAASKTGVLDTLKGVAISELGESTTDQILKLYGLDDPESLSQKEVSQRFYKFPEESRLYLPSQELWNCWPKAAFWHISAKSPFGSSCYGKDLSYHTLDTLYLFGAFDDELRKEGLEDHIDLAYCMRSSWLRFIHAQEPWDGAYRGTAATFDAGGMKYGPFAESRGWTRERSGRVEALQNLGFVETLRVASKGFYC